MVGRNIYCEAQCLNLKKQFILSPVRRNQPSKNQLSPPLLTLSSFRVYISWARENILKSSQFRRPFLYIVMRSFKRAFGDFG